MPFSLTPQVFLILRALVEEQLGLHYGADEVALFGDKVAVRAGEAGFTNALDYYYFLRYDSAGPAELEALADALVVGETYFFRELEPLRAAVMHVLAPAMAKRGAARVWSAGCATGEEPLSLAMVLDEAGLRAQCHIVATDVSSRAIAKAREGTLRERSMRVLPPNPPPSGFSARLTAIAEASLSREAPSRVQVARTLLASIEYRQLNLLDTAAIAELARFDLILCRNVLIYFADATVERVVGALTGALHADGRLLVGASESLLRFGTALRCEERGGAFFYAKAAG
jgi:chemotaxis protein methyltransferase CheR